MLNRLEVFSLGLSGKFKTLSIKSQAMATLLNICRDPHCSRHTWRIQWIWVFQLGDIIEGTIRVAILLSVFFLDFITLFYCLAPSWQLYFLKHTVTYFVMQFTDVWYVDINCCYWDETLQGCGLATSVLRTIHVKLWIMC